MSIMYVHVVFKFSLASHSFDLIQVKTVRNTLILFKVTAVLVGRIMVIMVIPHQLAYYNGAVMKYEVVTALRGSQTGIH